MAKIKFPKGVCCSEGCRAVVVFDQTNPNAPGTAQSTPDGDPFVMGYVHNVGNNVGTPMVTELEVPDSEFAAATPPATTAYLASTKAVYAGAMVEMLVDFNVINPTLPCTRTVSQSDLGVGTLAPSGDTNCCQ